MIKTSLMTCAAAAFAFVACPVAAHSPDAQELGSVKFPTSCDASVQPLFERGVAQLHSFWFTEAGKTFKAVLDRDPACVIAYWGLAVNSLGNSLSGPPPLKELQAASAALDRAHAIGGGTPREHDWLEAIGAYYRDYDKVAVQARLTAYANALEEMTRRYPDDEEVRIYYALALQASAPGGDKTYANQRRSAQILEEVYSRNPQHPGAAHYLIHAYDFPPLAQLGLAAARKYAGIAPASPHARHMPAHIYTMLGLWEESIASNRAAVEIQPDYYHARDFMVYAHLQLAQDASACAAIEEAQIELKSRPATLRGYKNSAAAMPARYPLEHGDWAGAAALPLTSNDWAFADSITRFARGLGMARSGDVSGARREVEALKSLRKTLEGANESYWAARAEEEILAVSGWIAMAEGESGLAEKLLRAAADGEDASIKNVALEIRLYPMRELLADLLLQSGRAREALADYEAALRENPNRYRGLYGAAMAAQKAGDKQKARTYFEKLLALARNADGSRSELERAKSYLANR